MTQYYPVFVTYGSTGEQSLIDFIPAQSTSQALEKASNNWHPYFRSLGIEIEEIFVPKTPDTELTVQKYDNKAQEIFNKSFFQLSQCGKLNLVEIIEGIRG